MPHLIEKDIRTGQHMFARHTNAPCWHNLGTIIDRPMNSEEALRLAHLDFLVKKAPMYFRTKESTEENPIYKEVPGYYGTFREDTDYHLGIVESRYEVLQNFETFQIIDDIVGDLEAVYETAGALKGGKTIFITAKLPDYIKVDEEVIDQYLIITNNHEGASSLRIFFSPIVVVCNNTLQCAIKGTAKSISIRHSKNMKNILATVDKSLEIINQLKVDLESTTEILMNKEVDSQSKVNSYFEQLHNQFKELQGPQCKFLDTMNEYYFEGIGQQQACRQDTAWGAYQAVTGWVCNYRNFRSSESKFKSLINGTSYKIMNQAKELALASF